MAARIAPSPTATPPLAQKLPPKFAAIASACRPTVSPRRISAASAAVLTAVSDVWIRAAVRTPRTLIQVSSATDSTARSRWDERPTATSPIGGGKVNVGPRRTAGGRAGPKNPGERAEAPPPAPEGAGL